MKRHLKKVLFCTIALALGAGAYLSFQLARSSAQPVSDLTLANIEAMAGANPDEHPLMCLGSEWMCASSSEADTWVPGYNVYNGGIPDIW